MPHGTERYDAEETEAVWLQGDGGSLRGMRIVIEVCETDLANAQAIQVFSANYKAKSQETLSVRGEGTMNVATPVSNAAATTDFERQDMAT